MQLTERSTIGAITVTPAGHVEVRRDDYVLRGDTIVAGPSYHRHVLAPGDDLSAQDSRVAQIARAAWTDEVVAAHRQRETAPPNR